MRVLVVSNVYGDFKYLIKQIDSVDPDFTVLLGMSGLHLQRQIPDHIGSSSPVLSKEKMRILRTRNMSFSSLYSNSLRLPSKVFCVAGFGDDGTLFDDLATGKCRIHNLVAMHCGMIYEYGGVKFIGLGGKWSNSKYPSKIKAKNLFGLPEMEKVFGLEDKVSMVFVNDVVGGAERNGAMDLTKSVEIDGVKRDTFSISEHLDSDVLFIGDAPMKPPSDDWVPYRFMREKKLCFCNDMKVRCYVYNTDKEVISFTQ